MVNYIDFTETKLELGYDYGAVGGMRFKTTIIKDGEKNEQRNVDWWLPLGRWQLGERQLLESDLENIKELEYLRGFHQNRKGSNQGFRFKDWSDYQANDEFIGVGNGTKTQWQLTKIYALDSEQAYRPITKPVEGTVKVYLDNIQSLTGWSVDYATGILTFNTPPESGVMIDADFEFDIPVWFETDEFSYTLEGYQRNPETGDVTAIYRLGNLAVQEGRIPLSLPYNYLLPVPQKLEPTLNLGIIDNTLAKDKFDTSKESVTSGYVRRDRNIQEAESYLEISKNWNQEELNNLLNFFWNCKGKASTFILELNNKKYLVRFKEDNLNIKFLVYDRATEDSIYAIANLGFYVFRCLAEPPILPDFLANDSINFIDYRIGFTEDPIDLPNTFTPFATSSGSNSSSGQVGAAGGGGASSSGGGGNSDARGFGGGGGELEDIVIPPNFTPRLVTELRGLPIIIGSIPATAPFTGSDLYLAFPNEPYDGTFNLVDTGWAIQNESDTVLFRNDTAITVLGLRPRATDVRDVIGFAAVLEIFLDLSWQITNIANSTGYAWANNIIKEWDADNTAITFVAAFNPELITGNQPRNIAVRFTDGAFPYNFNNLRQSQPPYFLSSNQLVEGSFYRAFEGNNVTIKRAINNVGVTEFAFPNAQANTAQLVGGQDNNGNVGMAFIRIKLCNNEINFDDLSSCENGSLTDHIALFERLGDGNGLRWVGSIP